MKRPQFMREQIDLMIELYQARGYSADVIARLFKTNATTVFKAIDGKLQARDEVYRLDAREHGITITRDGADLILSFALAPDAPERWIPASEAISDQEFETLTFEGARYMRAEAIQ